ncbi:MAG: hypothetical protein LBO67_08810 [Spirochaetaceae bacterium]|nr:hypothetical protein [Spirochaetaceae bacterium]
MYRKIWLLLWSIGLTLSNAGYAQEPKKFSLGNFGFSLASKPLKEGSITDLGFNLKYTDTLSGAVNFRSTAISKNEELFEVKDSLNAVNEQLFEVFFLPFQYAMRAAERYTFSLGGGLYYENNTLTEKGFFNMPELENLEKERVNSYTNDFSLHLVGPLLEGGFSRGARIQCVQRLKPLD